MKNCYAYIRVSTVKQGERGSSMQEQRDAIEQYARRHDLTIVSWFEELETAAKRGRHIFSRMLTLLQGGKADGVILHKIDRGARNLKDWVDLNDLIEHGTEVHLAHESLDLHSRGGRLSADIQAVVAADYIRNLREEVRKGFYGRLKQGLYPLWAPIGYLDKGGGNPKEPDPVRGPLVAKAFELYASGAFSLNSLGTELHRLGLRNKRGGRMTRSGLSTVLNNPFYIGLIRIRRTGQNFPGIHQPLITKTVFDRVQAVLTGKTNTRVQKYDFLFRRLVRCRHCDYTLIGERQKGFVYYRCHTSKCPTRCIREERVGEELQKILSRVQLTREELADLSVLAANFRAKWSTERRGHIQSLSLNRKQIEQRLDRLTDAYVDRMIDKTLFERRKQALLMEQQTIQEKSAELSATETSIPQRLEKFLEQIANVYSSYELGLPGEKRELVKTVTSNCLAEGKNVAFALRSPFRELANRSETPSGGPPRTTPRTEIRKLFDTLVHYFAEEAPHVEPSGKAL